MKNAITEITVNSILQAVLTIMIWGTVCYLYIADKVVPDALLGAGGIILGFYFHSVATNTQLIKNARANS